LTLQIYFRSIFLISNKKVICLFQIYGSIASFRNEVRVGFSEDDTFLITFILNSFKNDQKYFGKNHV